MDGGRGEDDVPDKLIIRQLIRPCDAGDGVEVRWDDKSCPALPTDEAERYCQHLHCLLFLCIGGIRNLHGTPSHCSAVDIHLIDIALHFATSGVFDIVVQLVGDEIHTSRL